MAPKQIKPTTEVYEILKSFHVSDNQLRELMSKFMNELNKGLAKATHAAAVVKCYPTYIQNLPTGRERGKYLAIDMGGSLRIIVVELENKYSELTSKTFAIPPEKMVGSGKVLFDHVASCLRNFIEEQNLKDTCLPLGLTFTFPLEQKAIDSGIIVQFTKGFKCDDIIGEDVVAVLKEALARCGIEKNVVIKAVINDTAGTLIACAYKNPNCKIGLILSTGTNACYVEKQKKAEMFDAKDRGSGIVLINTEWGAFGNDGSLDYIRTPEDHEIDIESNNPGKQIHEKMISGMYMGELVRLLMLKCAEKGALFNGKKSPLLNTKDKFLTKYVSDIESDKPGNFANCRTILTELGLKNLTETDLNNVRYICESVSKRAASMVAAGLCTLIKKTEEKIVTIGIDGSVYKNHPHFHLSVIEKMKRLIKPGVVFELTQAKDGSGIGAALAAASAK